ncbi:FkbM family methyltransferase [Spirulina sp. CS-785/01]|uniref:FkbM family methyltransferase n=1 Tax=Spirulina sp. CS-785/01 TaxID=3021716 RepID=UPI00232F89DF|nr:FkbM family methyltransferase [Spirulina sp. CS-785/01]MDB9312680.1 FkbM family methyltransferase [Spirulina sp. CS-785/01]
MASPYQLSIINYQLPMIATRIKQNTLQQVASLVSQFPWVEGQLVRLCRSPWARNRLKLGAIAYAYLALDLPNPRLATLDHYQLWVNLQEYQGIFLYFFGQSLEPFASGLVTQLVQPGNTCVDVGANMGCYTFLLASQVGETGRVLAFEPQLTLRTLLERSVASNGYDNFVQIEPYATFSQSGETLRLYTSCDRHNSGIASMIRYGDFLDADRQGKLI